jgi:hypothetical protein
MNFAMAQVLMAGSWRGMKSAMGFGPIVKSHGGWRRQWVLRHGGPMAEWRNGELVIATKPPPEKMTSCRQEIRGGVARASSFGP